jgi:hypothetical protein
MKKIEYKILCIYKFVVMNYIRTKLHEFTMKLSWIISKEYITNQLVDNYRIYQIYSRDKINFENIPQCNINDLESFYRENWIKILHLTDVERFGLKFKDTIWNRIKEVKFLNDNDEKIKNTIILFNKKPILVINDEKGIPVQRKYYVTNTRYFKIDTPFGLYMSQY